MAQPGGDYPGNPQPWATEPKVRFEVISEAWQLFQQQMGVWIPAVLIAFLFAFALVLMIMFGTAFIIAITRASIIALPMIFLVDFALVCGQIFLTGGLIRMAIKQVRGEPIAIADMFTAGDVFPALLGAGLLMIIAVMVGSMCLVLPGLVLGGMLMLTIPLVVDQKLGAIEALQRSFETFKKEWLMIALLNFVLGLIGQLGGVLCGVGALFTLPLVFLGQALVYRDFILNPMNPATPYDNYPVPAGGAYTPPAGGYTPPAGGYTPPAGGYTPPAGGYTPPYGSGVEQPTGSYAPPPPITETAPVEETQPTQSEEPPRY